jgi:hypothetical protein
MTLKNWQVDHNTLYGNAFDHPKYSNGTYVHTSQIISAAYDDGIFLFRTENSVYECHSQSFSGSNVELNRLAVKCPAE